MSTYRKELDCCGSSTETEAWEPETCPFCTESETIRTQKATIERLSEQRDRLLSELKLSIRSKKASELIAEIEASK